MNHEHTISLKNRLVDFLYLHDSLGGVAKNLAFTKW